MIQTTIRRLGALLDRSPVAQVALLIFAMVVAMLLGEYTGLFGA
ncbi:hypothetical protein SAMN05661080_04683 [Modestobacter sp. DSM 44400]|nr:hypothetical protein [Modestobacter sp. DSM 44400]SDY81145.1 hypothetical protein SAMN05661080_04683 [Modestobacter sp. DSM 44400]